MPLVVPYTLRLPPALAHRFDLARLLASDSERSWSQSYELLEQFELRTQERSFARRLLEEKSNLRLYRANQRLYCGDFIIVDMSVSPVAARRLLFVELKTGQALRMVGPGHIQMQNWRQARSEIAQDETTIGPEAEAHFLIGGEAEILAYLV